MVCVEEVPLLKQLRAKHGNDDFVLLGVSVDEEEAPLTRMIAEKGIGWPQVWQGPGFSGPVAKQYAVDGTPLIYLIDRGGHIAGRFRSIKNIDREIVEALTAPANAPTRTARDSWQRPYALMEKLGIVSGSTVADVGSGEGYFTLRLAARVGDKGKVYAVDLDDRALAKLRDTAQAQGFSQVLTIRGGTENPKLPVSSVDVVLIVDAYHEFRAYDAMLAGISAALKPGGRVGVLDTADMPGRPRAEYHERHRLPPELLIEEASRRGLRLKFFDADFVSQGNSKNYLAIFEKPVP